MEWWSLPLKSVEKELSTSTYQGLQEGQAQQRLEKDGENVLKQNDGRRNFLFRFLAQFNDFMILLLLGAAGISFLMSYLSGEKEYIDSVIIVAIVVVNNLLGVIQESKAHKALEALKGLSAPKAIVLRDGKRREIPAAQVVPGDVLLLEAGGYICADGRIVESKGLKTEESAITGEAMGVEKDTLLYPEHTALGDRKNMVLSGSYALSGSGRAVVTATGMQTEIGRIAGLLSEQEEQETPLQKKLDSAGKMLGLGALGICAIIFVMGILRHQPPFTMFMTSVSLAVAAIPEGLPAIVTIVLAIGTQRMSKKNTIIRRLPAVETLGGAEIICSDKTGTLTQNRMKVVQMSGYRKKMGEKELAFLANLFALCNNCRIEGGKPKGEPTEVALAEAAKDAGISLEQAEKAMPRVGEIPFSSERKLMTTVHALEDGTWISVTKGAPDILLEQCITCVDEGRHVPFDSSKKSRTRVRNGEMAAGALRVIAVAFRHWKELPKKFTPENMEQDLIFAGMAGMIDPPRPEAARAVEICKKAGIRPVMITGDHVLTAQAIAQELGIYSRGDSCITGQELAKMTDEELEEAVEQCTVFARVAPEHKVRIVRAFQKDGRVVAMTGDGVNDAPALKAADIGCAMGRSGTEVAKGAADMILTDDNFATIVDAVREGRGIYDNIRKAILFLLSSNIGEIITIFVAMCFGWASPLLPIQLLWVNLVTDSLPAIALGMDPVEEDCMSRAPRKRATSLFGDGMGEKILFEGMMIGFLALLAFGIGHIYFDKYDQHIVGRTMCFAVLSISQLVHAFNVQTEHSLLEVSPVRNPWLIGAFCIGLFLQTIVIMSERLAGVFKVCLLNEVQWLIVAALAAAPLLIVELEKWRGRRVVRKEAKKALAQA